jgi:hypothetical protein
MMMILRKVLLIISLLICGISYTAKGQVVEYGLTEKEEQTNIPKQSDNITQQRKKVGVVLSGGGAKGFAHIGVLKVL